VLKSDPSSCLDAQVTSRVISAAADLALVLDAEGVVLEVSVGEGFGADAARWAGLVGRRWTEAVAADSTFKVEQLVREAFEGSVSRSREVNLADAEGAALFRFSAVQLDGARVVALGRDLRALAALQQQMIAAQQEMDHEYARLRHADSQYRALFHLAAEGVVVAEAASLKVLEASPSAALLLESSAQALAGRTLEQLFEPGAWPRVQALLAAAEAGGRATEAQVGLLGTSREVAAQVSLFRQGGAALLMLRLRPAGVSAVAAGARGARMLAVLEAMPDGFVVVGPDLRVLGANRAFCEMVLEANERDLLGQPLERWLGRAGLDLQVLLKGLHEQGVVRNFATVVRSGFGPPQEATVSAVSAREGQVPCMGFSIRRVAPRLALVPSGFGIPRSMDQLRELVGRVSLTEIVRESANLIEQLCIEAALKVTGDNRASAARLLGLSRQHLYTKLRQYNLGGLEPLPG
jgi:transcriptional regulator PpsR